MIEFALVMFIAASIIMILKFIYFFVPPIVTITSVVVIIILYQTFYPYCQKKLKELNEAREAREARELRKRIEARELKINERKNEKEKYFKAREEYKQLYEQQFYTDIRAKTEAMNLIVPPKEIKIEITKINSSVCSSEAVPYIEAVFITYKLNE